MMAVRDTKPVRDEMYVSVDVETAGPVPGTYSMLALGACVVGKPDETFYAELRPINERFVPKALKVTGLSIEHLQDTGREPGDALHEFRNWIARVAGERRAVFVGFNASFDWSFVNWYFHTYVSENPFGIGGIDIKAYYMGLTGEKWSETTSKQLPARFQPTIHQTHNALDDARAQAEIFQKLLAANHPLSAPDEPDD